MTDVAIRPGSRVDTGGGASLGSVSGFSMVEMVIVLAIAAILIAIAVPLVERYIEQSRVLATVVEIGDMSKTIKNFEKSTGALPATLADVGFAAKVDAWGNPYEYFNQRTGSGNGQSRKDKALKPLNSDFDLYSIGKDGLTNASLNNARSRDDIVRARDGGFVGLAEEFDPP